MFSLWFGIITCVTALAADTSRLLPTAVAHTTSPKSVVTPPPEFHDLFKRAVATCGYLSGNSASPLTCANAFTCATTAHGGQNAFACCDSIQCTNDWGICLDFGSEYNCKGANLPASACSSIYGSILACSSDAPSCYRYARSISRGAYATQYSYACGANSADVLVLQTPTNGPQTFASTARYTNAAYTAPSTYNSGGTVGKSKLTTRSIILIVVIGGGLLLLFLGIGCMCCTRIRKNKRIANAQNAVNNQAQQQPPPPAYPSMANNNNAPPYVFSPVAQPQPWNNNAQPTHPMPPGMANKPTETRSTVQELNAPVRPLYEM